MLPAPLADRALSGVALFSRACNDKVAAASVRLREWNPPRETAGRRLGRGAWRLARGPGSLPGRRPRTSTWASSVSPDRRARLRCPAIVRPVDSPGAASPGLRHQRRTGGDGLGGTRRHPGDGHQARQLAARSVGRRATSPRYVAGLRSRGYRVAVPVVRLATEPALAVVPPRPRCRRQVEIATLPPPYRLLHARAGGPAGAPGRGHRRGDDLVDQQ